MNPNDKQRFLELLHNAVTYWVLHTDEYLTRAEAKEESDKAIEFEKMARALVEGDDAQG